MNALLLQTWAVIKINIKSIPQRFWMSASTTFAIALVVAVLLGFLAMGNGFQKTLRGTGSKDIAIILRAGSQAELNSIITRDQQRIIEEAPGILKDEGKALVSGELYVVVDGLKKTSNTKANLPLRGIGAQGLATRDGITIKEGRMFSPGSNEIVVGEALLREFSGFELGNEIRFGTSTWKVVGVFEAGGSVFESEIWGDLPIIQSLFNRGNSVQAMRVRLTEPSAIEALRTTFKDDPRLDVDVESEIAFFAEQAKQTNNLIQYLGWPLGIAMALGALAGALNTMYSSVSSRASEIATLRAIGFGGFPTFAGTLCEALVLAVVGALLGVGFAWAFFDGLSTSTLSGNFTQVVFTFKLGPDVVLQAVILALTVGLIGGFLPAIRATRQPITAAFNAE